MADDNVTVVWNGSRHHPGGRQLFTEEEHVHAARQRPNRTARDLSRAERTEIAQHAQLYGVGDAARTFRVPEATVKACLSLRGWA